MTLRILLGAIPALISGISHLITMIRDAPSLPVLETAEMCRCGHLESDHSWSMDDYRCYHDVPLDVGNMVTQCWCRDFITVIEPGFFTNQIMSCQNCGHMQGVHDAGRRFCRENQCHCMDYVNPVGSPPIGGSSTSPPLVLGTQVYTSLQVRATGSPVPQWARSMFPDSLSPQIDFKEEKHIRTVKLPKERA